MSTNYRLQLAKLLGDLADLLQSMLGAQQTQRL
jgi:hypothetical protein